MSHAWVPRAPSAHGERSVPPLLPALVHYEAAASSVIVARERSGLRDVLQQHPSFTEIRVTDALIDDIVSDEYERA